MDPNNRTNHPKDSYKTKKTNATPRNELPLKINSDLTKFAEAYPKIAWTSLGQKFSCNKTSTNTIKKNKPKFLDEGNQRNLANKKRGRKQT